MASMGVEARVAGRGWVVGRSGAGGEDLRGRGLLVQVDLVVGVLGRMLFVGWGSAFAHGGEASCKLVLVLAHARSHLLHGVASVINARQEDYSEGRCRRETRSK